MPNETVLPSIVIYGTKTPMTRQFGPCAQRSYWLQLWKSVEQPSTNLTYEINQQMHMYKICFITRY